MLGKPDFGSVDQLVAPTIAMRNSPFFPRGIQGLERIKRLIANVRSMISDLWVRVDDMVAESDKVALHWTSGGTQSGQWDEGIPPTGKHVIRSGLDIYRLEGRMIVELDEVEDGLSLLHQVNALQTWKPDG